MLTDSPLHTLLIEKPNNVGLTSGKPIREEDISQWYDKI